MANDLEWNSPFRNFCCYYKMPKTYYVVSYYIMSDYSTLYVWRRVYMTLYNMTRCRDIRYYIVSRHVRRCIRFWGILLDICAYYFDFQIFIHVIFILVAHLIFWCLLGYRIRHSRKTYNLVLILTWLSNFYAIFTLVYQNYSDAVYWCRTCNVIVSVPF